MAPESDDSSARAPEGSRPDESPRRARSILAGSVLLSALLHAGLFGGLYWLPPLDLGVDIDLQWRETSDELRGLGQRRADRFAQIDAPPDSPESDDEPSESPTPSIDDERLAEALDGSWEPPNAPDPPGAASEPEPSPGDDPPPARESATEPDAPDDPQAAEPFGELRDHDALERAGPNDLPDMRSFAPGNARMSALIRFDRLRGRPYQSVVDEIVRRLPDYRLLLADRDVDPTRELDWLFMASPDPRYVHHTFLAVRHGFSTDRVTELLDARYPEPPAWRTFESFPVRPLVPDQPDYRDPRRILLTGQGLALVARADLLPEIAKPLAADSKLLRPDGDRETSERTGGERPPRLLDGIARLHRVAADGETLVLVSARGMRTRLPGVAEPLDFESVRLSVTDPSRPTLTIDVQFAAEQGATEFAERFPALRRAVDEAIPFSGALGLRAVLNELECRADGRFATIRGAFTPRKVAELGDLLLPFLPRPPALERLPEPPAERDDGSPDDEADAGQQPNQQPK